MEELADTELCPCGRGIPYGQCCKTKGILWYKDGKVFHKCYGASLSEEALEVFENNRNSFIDLFGREPSNDDLILFDTSAHTNDFFRDELTFLQNLGLPKEWKYAYYRTEGLMPTVENESFLSKHDLTLFREYCHEYTKLMDADCQDGNINALLLTSIANSMFETACDTVLPKILSGLEYFLNTTSESTGSIVAPPNSLKEYASFIAIRTIRALESISLLGVDYKAESIHSLGRSLFECYVYLKNVNDNDTFFDNKVLPILNSHEYGFEILDGKINYKKLHISKVIKSTKRPKIGSLQQLNSACGPKIDVDLYEYYYRAACQFVHIDAFTARSCFYEEDIYAEFDPSLVAIICTLSIAILVLEELVNLSLTSTQQAKDLEYLVSNCAYSVCDCLMMLVIDSEQVEDEYRQLLERLKMVKGNTWCFDKP